MLARIAAHLDERRLLGTRLIVEPPAYRQLTVVVSAYARPGFGAVEVREDVLREVNRLFHPLVGGPEGTGWPLGRAVQAQEVAVALAAVAGVDMTRELSVQLFPDAAGRAAGAGNDRVERFELGPTDLVFSFEHQVRVRR
jgi:hypothetical protein